MYEWSPIEVSFEKCEPEACWCRIQQGQVCQLPRQVLPSGWIWRTPSVWPCLSHRPMASRLTTRRSWRSGRACWTSWRCRPKTKCKENIWSCLIFGLVHHSNSIKSFRAYLCFFGPELEQCLKDEVDERWITTFYFPFLLMVDFERKMME